MKAGKYTAAMMLLGVGAALLTDMITGREITAALIKWWPVVLIALGVEYMIVSLVHRKSEKTIGISFGSLFFAVVISMAAIAVSNAANLAFLRDWGIRLGETLSIRNFSSADESGQRFEMDPVYAAVDGETETIRLRNVNGNVIVRPGDVKEIELKGTVFVQPSVKNAEEIARKTEIRVERQGDRLDIIVDGKDYRLYGIKQSPRVNLAVTVPRGLERDWHIDVTNGNVDVSGLSVPGRLFAETVHGSVELSDITGNAAGDSANGTVTIRKVSGDAFADTASGRITIEGVGGKAEAETTHGRVVLRNIRGDALAGSTNGDVLLERIGGKTKVDTTNGDVHVTEAGGPVEAETVNGDITVETASLSGNYDLESTNGKIVLNLPKDASFAVNGETTWGGIETNFPLAVDGKKIKGSVNGGIYKLEIKTNGGIVINAN